MKLRLPLLLRLALLSTAAAYTLGSGCLFADDAPADAAQDDPIAEAVDEEESDSPAIGFEGYTESQLVDIQSSDSAGAVIRQMLENSTTGAVANVGTTSSTSNGATTAAESPALTLSAPAEPVTDTTLTTSTLSDSAGEGAVAPFFSAEEAAALVVASPATSTPSLKNASTATLSSSDSPDETTSSVVANGVVSSSIASVGSAGGAGASSGGGSASYSLTSSAPDSSSSLVITTPTDDTSSDPIAEDVLEDSSTEDTTTSTTLPDSSASTLAGSSSTTTTTTTRTLPALKLLGAADSSESEVVVSVNGTDISSGGKIDYVEYSKDASTLYVPVGGSSSSSYPWTGSVTSINVNLDSFYIRPGNATQTTFSVTTLTTGKVGANIDIRNNEWGSDSANAWNRALNLSVDCLKINGSASLSVNKTKDGNIEVTIGRVENSTESSEVPVLTTVSNTGTLNLGTAATEVEAASTISTGSITNSGTLNLYGNLSTTSTISNSGTIDLGSGVSLSFDSLEHLDAWYHDTKFETGTVLNSGYLSGRYLIKGGTVSKTDETVSATCGDNSYALDFSTVAGAVLKNAGDANDGVYYISSGDSLLYGDAGNSMADDTTTSIVLNGGTLQLGETALGKVVGLSQASTLQLNEGATFAASSVVASNAQQSGQIATNGNTLSLSGSGTYDMGSMSDSARTLANGVSLGSSWEGVLRISSSNNWTNLKLNDYVRLDNGVSMSSVELFGVTAWLPSGGSNSARLILTNKSDGTAAFTINDGFVGTTSTFLGSVSGSGDIKITLVNPNNTVFSFEGGVSGWTGRYIMSTAKTTTVKFAGASSLVNAAIEQQNSDGTLNITAAATGGTTFANAITASSLTATTALTLSAKKEGEKYVATADTLTGALSASGQAVTIDNELVTLTVTGATTAASFSNAGKAYLNGGATITGVLRNTGTLSLGGTSTVGKIEGAATVSGNLTLTGVDSVYHSGGALNFSGSSKLTLGTGATATNPFIHSDGKSFKVGLISGSILNGSTVDLQGLSGRQTATYSGEGDSAVITINGGPLNLVWNNPSGGEWSTDTTSEKNWIAGETEEYFYSGDHVTIGAYQVTTSGNLIAGNVTLNGATLTVADGSSLTANSMTIGGTTSISGTGSLTVGSVALNGATLTIGEGTTLSTSSMTISGATTIDNSANTSLYTQSSVTLSDGTSLTLKNTNLTAGGTTAGGTLTVDGNGMLILIETSELQDLVINGGIVKTERSDRGKAQISGTVTVKAGGTYLVSGANKDGLGWGDGATRAIKLLAGDENTHAVLDLNGKRNTATTVLYLNGYATVQNGIWDPYDTNSEQKGGTIVVSGTGNVIASNVDIRLRDSGGAVFDVSLNSDVEMGGKFTLSEDGYGVSKTIVKKGDGLLTVTGESSIGNAVFVYAGTLKLAGAAGKVGSGAITLSSNAVLELAHTAECPLSGNISSAEGATGTTLRVSGSGAETLSGTVNVAATDIQSGTLKLSGSSASLGALTVGDGAGLSATGSSQSLNLSAVVQNQGTLSLGGVSTLTFTVSDVFDSFSYTDTVTGAGAKNGFIDRYWLIRNSGSGTISGLSVADVTVNGTSKNASSDGTGLYAAVEAVDLGVTDGTNLNSIYVVNEGNLVYNDTASNSSGNSAVKQLWLTGGTLELAQSDIKSGVGVHVKQDSTVNIGTNRTLTDSQVASVENGATLTLTGSGTYSLAVGQIGETASLTSGVALDTGESGFTGTVLLNKGTTLNGTDLSALTNGSYSSVTMNGVSGTLKSGDISTNLVLEDCSELQGAEKALTINGAGSIRFSGAISGTGEMKIAPSDAAAENTLIFSGDVSGWTGELEVFKGIANVRFTGEAKAINASVANRPTESVVNMVVDASESRSFTRGISANTLLLTQGTKGKVVDMSGGSYNVYTKTDLTESNVILQVKRTGVDSYLYSALTELAADGSSGINISDGEKTLTTIRTNTTDSSSPGNATLSPCMFTYDNTNGRAVITGSTIDRAVIDVVNGSTLELSSVVLTNSCWVHDDDASTPAPTGHLVLNGVELQMAKGTASTEDGSGVALTLTGGVTAATNADGSAKTLTGKVYVMDLTRISDFATIKGGDDGGLTLNFDTYGNGFAELYETLKGYDYVAVKFSDDVLSVDFESLKVTSKITNGQNAEATSQGYYYNNNGASGVVVYFDAIALPEPTTSTLGLLALAALCARRRRSRTRAHAEHA